MPHLFLPKVDEVVDDGELIEHAGDKYEDVTRRVMQHPPRENQQVSSSHLITTKSLS